MSGYPGYGYPSGPLGDAVVLRNKQIESLRQYCPNVREVERGTVFEVPFYLPSRRTVTLRVNLPPTFPTSAPWMVLMPAMRHALLGAGGQVSPMANDQLRSWGVHSSLGKTVYDVVQRFSVDPPIDDPSQQQQQQQPQTLQQPPIYTPSSGGSPIPSSSSTTSQSPPPSSSSATVPKELLEGKTLEELEAILKDEAQFDKVFAELPAVKEISRVQSELRTTLADAAKRNVELSEQVTAANAELETRRVETQKVKAQYEELAGKKAKLVGEYSPAAVMKLLGEAAKRADEQSEALVKKFHDGEMPAAEFVKQYREARALYHTRAAKHDSLKATMN